MSDAQKKEKIKIYEIIYYKKPMNNVMKQKKVKGKK